VTLPSVSSGTLLVQYDASTLGLADLAAVSSWPDSSGNGRNLSQGSGTLQPIFHANAQNGLGVVTFDGSNDTMGATVPAAQYSPLTTLAVVAWVSGTWKTFCGIGSNRELCGGVDGSSYWEESSTAGSSVSCPSGPTSGVYYYTTFVINGASSLIRINGGAVTGSGTLAAADASATALSIGSAGAANYWAGSVGEVVVYTGALNSTDYTAVEGYLRDKWFYQTVRPDADLDTTGWSTAPLFSKVNDSSDATVTTSTI
jgi:hypothetical protein